MSTPAREAAAAVALRPAERPIAFTARWKLAIAAPYLAMREHGAGDSPLGWRGIPSRTQTQVCIRAPFLSFVQSGPVLSISLIATLFHDRSAASGYRKRPPQDRTCHAPVAYIGTARLPPEPHTERPPQDHPRRPAPRCRDERPRMGIPPQ